MHGYLFESHKKNTVFPMIGKSAFLNRTILAFSVFIFFRKRVADLDLMPLIV